ncbi:MAG TPA: acryloyl-CoA reductase [Candidatus Limnocylindrales bacterium]|nr:acryloyl-CoA reductase [Candidatus Limnocylindrales bacterium]
MRAVLATKADDRVDLRIGQLEMDDLPPGDVTIRVAYSSINYKDGLAVTPGGGVARISPLVPGIDLAGTVVASGSADVAPGDAVIAHGYALGASRHGGFAELARVPAGWVVPLPEGLTLREAMAVGTAGFTAALSVQALEERGLAPSGGPVLVLGATGGVGAAAVAILARRGYDVWASTGKPDHAYLRTIGAGHVLRREETSAPSTRPLESARWAGCIDPVGGASLAYALRTLQYGGAVASSGLTGGVELHTTVLPFILRGVALLGIDSAQLPIEQRRALWRRIGGDLKPGQLDRLITRTVSLEELPDALRRTVDGGNLGRTVVAISA